MLVELAIADLAIIASVRVQFGPGLNVLTGETGAGKSIIVDAMSLVLGARASSELVRSGSDRALVEAIFAPPPETLGAAAGALEATGIAPEDGLLILGREITRSGRSICRLNGRVVTAGALREVGRHLVDIHGQGEHLSLLRPRRQLELLDRYAGLEDDRTTLAERVAALRRARDERRALQRDERELAQRADLLRYQIDEIAAARLDPDEEEALGRERSLLVNAERLQQAAAEAYALLAGDERRAAITDLLSRVVGVLEEMLRADEALSTQHVAALNALDQLEELARTMRDYRERVEHDPRRLEAVEERLELMRTLRRKYGDSIADVLAHAERAACELASLESGEERAAELDACIEALEGEIAVAAAALSCARRAAAERLAAEIEGELAELAMEQARFVVQIEREDDPGGIVVEGRRLAVDATGIDRVVFLIAPNPGEEPKPVAAIASGGETARLMLALKSALSAADAVPTLIFDEIDAGIGGRAGGVVGAKLWHLSRRHQVFCVTHLPQIAGHAERHLRVAKGLTGGRTISTVEPLEGATRLEELATMLGGADTDLARRNAAELLDRAQALHTAPEERS